MYFSVDDVNITYKGVKGKGTATIIEDPSSLARTVMKVDSLCPPMSYSNEENDISYLWYYGF